MTGFRERLQGLEVLLASPDPRPAISSYHNMPFAIFRYDPEDEFELRKQVGMLSTRLEQGGKRVTRISLADCMQEVMSAVQPLDDWYRVERRIGTEKVVDTVHEVLEAADALVEGVLARIPTDPDPERDVVYLTRAGALFPAYRPSPLVEKLHGQLDAPLILFYPGTPDGPVGLRFMGVLDADHTYRPKTF